MTPIVPTGPRRHLLAVAAVLACVGLVALPNTASASLVGALVSYRSLFPNTQSVLSNLGTKTVTPLTSFADVQNGLTSFFIGNQLVIENTLPRASTDRSSPSRMAA